MTEQETSGSGVDVVVGFDGSPAAREAVGWAARDAELLGARLRVVTSLTYSAFAAGRYAVPVIAELEATARSIADEGRALAVKVLPANDVTAEGVVGGAAKALVEASVNAQVTVLGTRGRGGVASALLGSVSYAVTAHARSTVVVVPEHGEDRVLHAPVVVGVDGGSFSKTAARYASDYAVRHGHPLNVLAAWQRPMSPGLQEASWGQPGPNWLEAPGEQAENHAHDAVTFVRKLHPQLQVDAEVVESTAAAALIAASRSAHLVVVGTRGLGGFERLILGSVSRATLHGTACPVAVARA